MAYEGICVGTLYQSATSRPFILEMPAQTLVHSVEDIALLTSMANRARQPEHLADSGHPHPWHIVTAQPRSTRKAFIIYICTSLLLLHAA